MRHVSAVTHILHQRQTISACRASSLFETSIAGRLPLLSLDAVVVETMDIAFWKFSKLGPARKPIGTIRISWVPTM